MNIFDLGVGGVYQISCKPTHRIYIGQTSSFLFRANQHFVKLNNQTHECLSMQNDWNLYLQDNFVFEILHYEDEETKRIEFEKNEVAKYTSKVLYNCAKSVGSNLLARTAQSISINGTIFASITKAVKLTNESKTSIIRKLNNPHDLSYIRLNKVNLNKYQVQIDAKIYTSTRKVVDIGLADRTAQVRQRCKSKKWPTWILKDRSNDYPIEE